MTIGAANIADGRLDVRSRGGNVTVTGSAAKDTRLWAIASRTQADTGHITAGLKLTGGRRHQVTAQGGNVHFTSLDVADGGLNVSATEARVAGAYQGGGIRIDGDATIHGRTALDARGGDIELHGQLKVIGDVTRLRTTKGRNGTGGRLVSAPHGAETDLHVNGVLRTLTAEQLCMNIKVDSLAWAVLRLDHIGTQVEPDDHGSLHVLDRSGWVRGANQTIRMHKTVDGLVRAYTA